MKVASLVPEPEPWIYTVHMVIEVDAPHLRDKSFPAVRPGHRQSWHVEGTHRYCVSMFECVLRGDYDYLSEYIAAVSVTARRAGKCRRVRARVNRATPEMRRRRYEDRLAHAEHMSIRRMVTHEDPAPVAGEIVVKPAVCA